MFEEISHGELFYSSNDFFSYPELKPEIDEGFDESLPKSEKLYEYLVAFSSEPATYCVGIVDMVNSTKISAEIGSSKVPRYYQLFLNSMSKILSRFGGFVIKNVGDCLVYYFPESGKSENKYGLLSCLECGLAMTESQKYISEQLIKEGLPEINFRVSADFGSVLIMKSNVSNSLDMIGSPLNMCSKINHMAEKNQFVVGGDLFQMSKGLDDYLFTGINDFSLDFKLSYPIYSVSRK
jgi:class 3 adenylate cyclase